MRPVMDTLHLEGIRPDSLGNYFVGMGLLAAMSRKWPEMRGCWRREHFVLVGTSLSDKNVIDYLINDWQPIHYDRWWAEGQKKDTKARTDELLQKARGTEVLEKVRLLDSHIVGTGRLTFNPLFGTGGNIGRRDLAEGYKDAKSLLQESSREERCDWLRLTLFGETTVKLPKLANAGTWFVYANKTFNSGQAWYREGRISPWSFLMALEGALLLTGNVSRRLRPSARPYAVFPFITEMPSPQSQEQVGLALSEFWAPLWNCPANITEVRMLFERGLTRVGYRAAKSPHEFAVAAMAAGVDSGVGMFVPFTFRRTTSSQVYEAIPRGHIQINESDTSAGHLIESIIPWIDHLPYEPKDIKQRGQFKGLRGPIEDAIIGLAERPDNPELWQKLLISLADIQNRIDLNKEFRGKCQAIPLLDSAWFAKAWPSPAPIIQVAQSIASVGAGSEFPLMTNVYGVATDPFGNVRFAGVERPQNVVWHTGEPLRILLDVLERRLIDADISASLPLGGPLTCESDHVAAFLSGTVDFREIVRWVPALSLIKWHPQPPEANRQNQIPQNGLYLLHGFFRPFFHPSDIIVDGEALLSQKRKLRSLTARRLLNLIRNNRLDDAISIARAQFHACGQDTISPTKGLQVDGERLAAALLIPMRSVDIVTCMRRWIIPRKTDR